MYFFFEIDWEKGRVEKKEGGAEASLIRDRSAGMGNLAQAPTL
jgi:hypothetical protein